mgnify:CR=1 FL=1
MILTKSLMNCFKNNIGGLVNEIFGELEILRTKNSDKMILWDFEERLKGLFFIIKYFIHFGFRSVFFYHKKF